MMGLWNPVVCSHSAFFAYRNYQLFRYKLSLDYRFREQLVRIYTALVILASIDWLVNSDFGFFFNDQGRL
jgi:hypothetical protein